MAYQTPRTYIPGELVTADHLNQEVRDNVSAVAPRGIVVQIGTPGAGVIPSGVKFYIPIPAAIEFTGWSLTADQPGSIVLDLWVDTWANFPPDVSDSITGTEKPTLVAQQKNQDLTLTSWDTDLDVGDVLGVNVDSAADVESVTLTLWAMPR